MLTPDRSLPLSSPPTVPAKRGGVARSDVVSAPDYQCVLVDDVWHATQEQASPPPVYRGGAWTICSVWAEFKRGYDRRRPTCSECLRACVAHERRQ